LYLLISILLHYLIAILMFTIEFLFRERYQINQRKPTWRTPIPESHKLTDTDIDVFVNSMIPIAMTGIFNKRCSPIFYDALHYLAIMRPNLVIPNVVEKVYPTLGSDIEPHKLITAMMCMITISRPLVQGSHIPNKGN
jgi:proteasome activator subunit 4